MVLILDARTKSAKAVFRRRVSVRAVAGWDCEVDMLVEMCSRKREGREVCSEEEEEDVLDMFCGGGVMVVIVEVVFEAVLLVVCVLLLM
jgi:hypothetical protein